MTTIAIVIERHPGRNIVRVTVGQQVVFNADHVSEETLVAVVRCVSEHWIARDPAIAALVERAQREAR